MGPLGRGVSDVAIHALRGETVMALAKLREAEQAGWRELWRYHRDFDPNLASIRNDPEFKAIFADIERDMAQQRARLAARPKDAPLELTDAEVAATPMEREPEAIWTALRRRKVVQWGVVYVAAAWGFLQGPRVRRRHLLLADAFLEPRLGFGIRKPSALRSSIIARQRKWVLDGVQDAETRTSSQDGAQ